VTRPTPPRRSRRSTWLRRGLPALAAVLLAGVLFVLVNGGGGDDDRNGAASTSSAAPAADPSDPDAEPTPSGPPAVITEAQAAPVVVRDGVPESARTIEAARVDFTSASDWTDGASVRVVRAEQRVSEGMGPGARAGQPQTVFTLELTNGAGVALDVSSVVVQAVYGATDIQASPLYDGDTVDFGGILAPGDVATAVYSFTVPDDQLGDVTLSVDVDGHRFPAVFTGRVTVR
jgi:hypothetical protein